MRRHVVLHVEYIGQVAVEAFRPDMAAGGRVDQLGGDPDARAGLSHAPLKHVTDAESPADLAQIDVLALEGEGRIARDDEGAAKSATAR